MSVTTKAGGLSTLTIDLSRNGASGPKRVEAGSVPPPATAWTWSFPLHAAGCHVGRAASRSTACFWWTRGRRGSMHSVQHSGTKRRHLPRPADRDRGHLRVIELIALFIGVRLTRSMTKSVAELYTATQYINRGELQHRSGCAPTTRCGLEGRSTP